MKAPGREETASIWQERVKPVVGRLGKERTALLPALESIQEALGLVPEEAVRYLGDTFKLPVAEIYSVISFYGMLTTAQSGKYVLRVCDSLSCHINRSQELIKSIGEILDIEPGQTTPDGKFTLEVVDCLGLCDQAPAMMVNQSFYGKLDRTTLEKLLNELRDKD